VVFPATEIAPCSRLFHALVPQRVLDTRPTDGLQAGETRGLALAGRGGVAPNATDVVMNITATNTSATSYLTVWAATDERPNASTLNWHTGQTVPNLVISATPETDGVVALYNAFGHVDVLADVVGYFADQ
jgi:hypothetical protein